MPPAAGAPRCPQVRALTWIASEGLVQTAAAERSVGEVTRPRAGRGVAREGPAPGSAKATPPGRASSAAVPPSACQRLKFLPPHGCLLI